VGSAANASSCPTPWTAQRLFIGETLTMYLSQQSVGDYPSTHILLGENSGE
jgi:hypothetical protein